MLSEVQQKLICDLNKLSEYLHPHMCSLLQQTYIRQPGIIPQQGNTVNENTKSDFHTKKAITLEDTQIYDLP